jgi:hypothetical protein
VAPDASPCVECVPTAVVAKLVRLSERLHFQGQMAPIWGVIQQPLKFAMHWLSRANSRQDATGLQEAGLNTAMKLIARVSSAGLDCRELWALGLAIVVLFGAANQSEKQLRCPRPAWMAQRLKTCVQVNTHRHFVPLRLAAAE